MLRAAVLALISRVLDHCIAWLGLILDQDRGAGWVAGWSLGGLEESGGMGGGGGRG